MVAPDGPGALPQQTQPCDIPLTKQATPSNSTSNTLSAGDGWVLVSEDTVTQPTSNPPASPGMITLRVDGIRRSLCPETYDDRNVTHVIKLSPDTPLSALEAKLRSELSGRKLSNNPIMVNLLTQFSCISDVKAIQGYKFAGFEGQISQDWKDVFTVPALVTTGKSCYDEAQGLKINMNQTIASFLSKAYPSPLEARLYDGDDSEYSYNDKSAPFVKVSAHSIAVGDIKEPDLVISFQRTVRVPETGKRHELPPGLGNFPIFDIRPFAANLPQSMVAKGGLFFPMYRKSHRTPSK